MVGYGESTRVVLLDREQQVLDDVDALVGLIRAFLQAGRDDESTEETRRACRRPGMEVQKC